MTAVLGVLVRRTLRRNPVGRLPLRLSLHLRRHQPRPAVFGPRPRGLRPDFDGRRPSGATRPAETAQCHGSGEGGSDPLSRRCRPLALVGPQRVLGGRSLPRREAVGVGSNGAG